MKNLNHKIKYSKIASAIALLTLNVVNSATALAQEDQVDSTDEMETIVISSNFRASLNQSVNTKRQAAVISDAISATELGRFPDANVAESLQRITGVQIQRLRGEGSQVSIRGLPPGFTQTTLNGRPVASAFNLGSATRSFDFSALPAEFVSKLEVYKSPSAELEEGGLSGTVIVNTPSPLDIGERKISSAHAQQNSNSGSATPKISGIYSDVFDDGAVGLTIGGTFSNRQSEPQSAIGRGFRRSRNGAQNIVILDKFEEERERSSFMATLEWEPRDDLRLRADGFYSDLDIDAARYAGEFYFGNSVGGGPVSVENPQTTTRVEVGDDQLATRLGLTNMEFRAASRYEKRTGSTSAYTLSADYTPDDWTIHAELSYSEADQVFDNTNVATQTILPDAAYDATLDNQVISVNLSQAAQNHILDIDNYRVLSFNGPWGRKNEDKISQAKIDFAREMDIALPSTLKFGFAYTGREQIGTAEQIVLSAPDFANLTGAAESQVFPGQPSAAAYLIPFSPSSGGYLDAYDGASQVPNFLVTDTKRFLSQYSRAEIEANATIQQNLTGVTDVEEDVLAGYVQLDFASDDNFISGNIGFRMVSTDQKSSGVSPDLTNIVSLPDSGGIIIIPGEEPVTVDRSYTDYLPSVNLKVNLTKDFFARFAASRTMSRPTLGLLSPSTTASNGPLTISQTNPHLDPFRSDNFDFALEWYFDDESLLSATFFDKDVVSLIRPSTEIATLDIISEAGDGTRTPASEEFIINKSINGEGANLRGVELSFQTAFTNLPGLLADTGLLFNYTYIDNSNPTEVVGASANNMNFTYYYEGDQVAARFSYTWRDQYLLDPGAQEGDGRFVESMGLLDASLTYYISEDYSVSLEATNLLETPTNMIDGNGYAAVFEDSGRNILLGVRANF